MFHAENAESAEGDIGGVMSNVNRMLMVRKWHVGEFLLGMLVLLCQQSSGIGYRPDPTKYRQALDAIVDYAYEDFVGRGVAIAREAIRGPDDCELIDSFLKGRDFYRLGRHRFPLEPKLPRLAELLGASYADLERVWRRMVEERRSKVQAPLTREELKVKVEALEKSREAPVHMDGGWCRSSSGREAVETVCTRCGKHIIYSELDEIYHAEPPEYYLKIAEELRKYGINIEVDGSATCPDCCGFPCDFKLSEFSGLVRLRKDLDFSKEKDCPEEVRYMKPGLEMRVVQQCGRGFSKSGYDVR